MCDGGQRDTGPSVEAFRANLREPMPLPKRVWLVVRNTLRKLFTLSDCCGHAGEPGC